MDSVFYKDYQDSWDEQCFREEVLKRVDGETILLDVGAGSGRVQQMNFRGVVKEVWGIDLDERALTNPFLDNALVGSAESMPFFRDESFDMVISNNVLEHVTKPDSLFKEVNRVLKNGGLFITKTPNKYHYFALMARATPTWFHKIYNRVRGRDAEDTFPTFYKVNCMKDQIRIATKSGFKVLEIRRIEGKPEYLRIALITYLIGVAYERLVNHFAIDALKVLLISKFEKL